MIVTEKTKLTYTRLYIPTMKEEVCTYESLLPWREAYYALAMDIVKWNSISPGVWQYYM